MPGSDSRLPVALVSDSVLDSLRFMLLCRRSCSCHRLRLRPPIGECMGGCPGCLRITHVLIDEQPSTPLDSHYCHTFPCNAHCKPWAAHNQLQTSNAL